jgi:HAD superfamily hydrolase (TIGR01549 family)
MISRIRDPAILFDLDGTLVDSNYLHVICWSNAFQDSGIQIPVWKIHRRIGMNGKALVRQLVRQHGGRGFKFDGEQLERKHDAAFQKGMKSIRPLPGAEKLLRHLTRMGLRWAIATTGAKEQTQRLLRLLRVSPNLIVTGDDVAKAKPSPEIFVLAANRMKTPMEHCIVVGDSIWDMLAAGRRRALSVGILSGGYSQAELEQSGAFRVYADPSDMLDHIEDLGLD